MSKAVNVQVKLGGRIRTSEQLIKLFNRKCKKEGIVREWKESQIHETKAQKKRRKKKQGAASHRAKQLKEQSDKANQNTERNYKR